MSGNEFAAGEEQGEDLDTAIEAMRELAASGAGQDPEVAAALGQALADRYDLHGDEGDRDAAITWLRRASDAPGHDMLDDLRLAMLLTGRGEERRDGPEIEAGLGHARRCLGAPDDDLAPLVRFVLGLGHLARAQSGPSPADFPLAVGYLRETAALLPEDGAERAEVEARLGVALAMWVLGDPATDRAAALDEAVARLDEARREIPPGDAYLVQVRYWLATAWSLRFMWYAGTEADLEHALAEFDAMLAGSLLGGPLADLCHTFAACLLLFRSAPGEFRRRSLQMDTGQMARVFADPPERPTPEAVRSALAHLDQVSDTDATAGLARLAPWLGSIATMAPGGPGHQDAPLLAGEITQSVAALEEALRPMPDDDPAAGEMLGMLGLLYGVQEITGTGQHRPGQSVESLLAAARLLGDAHPMVPLLRSMLGGAFGPPLSGGSPSGEDAAAAIELLDAILDQVPDEHPARAQTLLRLSALLVGPGAFLDHSVEHLKKLRQRLDAVLVRPSVSPADEAVHHVVLGIAEGIEGLLAPDASLVNSAMDRLKRAAGILPGDGQIQGYARFGLISLLSQRYMQDGELQYLDAAMHYAREMVQAADGTAIPEPFLRTAEYLLAAGPLARKASRLDPDQLDETIARMEALQYRFPDGDSMRSALGSDVNLLQALRSIGFLENDPATARLSIDRIEFAGPRRPTWRCPTPGPPPRMIRSTP